MMDKYESIVEELIVFLESKPELKTALEDGIREAELFDIPNLTKYYEFLNDMVKLIPDDSNVDPYTNKFYWIADKVLDNKTLGKSLKQEFQNWTHEFAIRWGEFLDTTKSAEKLSTLYTDPVYSIDDYFQPPSGYLTFNQFFAREIRPGERPAADPCDPLTIVSPADSFLKGVWTIKDNQINLKGVKHSVIDLLDLENIDNKYISEDYCEKLKKKFENGLFIHSFLNVNDYHRFHVPVGGEVKDVWDIHGNVYLKVYKNKDGSLGSDKDLLGWQFYQQRGLIVIDTKHEKIGYVAVLPVGMMQVSSVVLTPRKGRTLAKGDEFGYFAFGGSDIIVMFEKQFDYDPKVSFKRKHYLQGEMIAKVIKKS
jgi:phosphatidylserine decarboxylase precursor